MNKISFPYDKNFLTELEGVMVAQKRTSLYKPLVFILNNKNVVKGPFVWPKTKEKVILSCFRSELLHSVWKGNVPMVEKILCGENTAYMVFPNISKRMPTLKAKEEDVLQLHKDSEGREQKYKKMFVAQKEVKKSQGIIELSHYLKDTKPIDWDEEIIVSSLLHYMHRYIAGIGDCALRNILLVEQEDGKWLPFGIDLEDNRSASSKNAETLIDMLRGGKNWKKNTRENFLKILKKNKKVFLDDLETNVFPSLTENAKFQKLAEKYGLSAEKERSEFMKRAKKFDEKLLDRQKKRKLEETDFYEKETSKKCE